MGYVNLLSRDPDGKIRFAWDTVKNYSIENDTPVIILKMARILKDRFGFETRRPVSGTDETVISCTKEDVELLLGYDSSTGTYVEGRNRRGELRIGDFPGFLEGILDEPVFEGYIRALP
jgi:hypothetical protein